jgi:hypothetical protein
MYWARGHVISSHGITLQLGCMAWAPSDDLGVVLLYITIATAAQDRRHWLT